MMGLRVLVTGGAGQLARAIRNKWKGQEPLLPEESVLDLGNRETIPPSWTTWSLASHLIDRNRIRRIFHLAVESHVDRSLPALSSSFRPTTWGHLPCLRPPARPGPGTGPAVSCTSAPTRFTERWVKRAGSTERWPTRRAGGDRFRRRVG